MSTTSTTIVRRIARLGYSALGFGVAFCLLCVLRGAPVQAQAPGVNLTALYNQVQALQSTVNAQAATISNLQTTVNTQVTQIAGLQTTVNTQGTQITGLQSTVSSQGLELAFLQTRVNSQGTQISALQAQTQFISAGTDENGYAATFITGCNVWVQDGSGNTSPGAGHQAGLGNLIIGYNAIGNPTGDTRSGSHNLILGDQNSYGNNGGLIAGQGNNIFGLYATITGGAGNVASGDESSVTGGFQNVANNSYSSVSGGSDNKATGLAASVSGGEFITESNVDGWEAGSYHSP